MNSRDEQGRRHHRGSHGGAGRRDPDREERALEALVVAALRRQDVEGMTFEKLLAFERDLTREDRAAIDALALDAAGRHLVDRILSCHVAMDGSLRGSVPTIEPVGRTSGGAAGGARGVLGRPAGEPFSLSSKGARVMKSLVLSVLVISALAGAVVIGTRGDGRSPAVGRLDQETVDLLVSRLNRIEERLGQLGELEDRVDRIASRAAAAKASRPAPAGEHAAGGDEADPMNATLASGESDDLRSYIVQVMDEVHEEKVAEQRRVAEERQRELQELREGPYGNHNYRVNTLARRLDLSDRQKEHYYLNLVEYNRLIDQSRERESQDQENRQQYRDERRRIRGEFSQVILSSLAPEQAEVFSALPSHEQQPDARATIVTRSFQLAPGVVPPAREPFFETITEVPAGGVAFDAAGAVEVQVFDEYTSSQEALKAAEMEAERARMEAKRAAELEAAAKRAAEEAASDK